MGKNLFFKIAAAPFLIIYFDWVILIFFISLLTPLLCIPLILLNVFLVLDNTIQKRSEKKDRFNRFVLIAFNILYPLLISLPFIERYIFVYNYISAAAFIAGLLVECAGGLLVIIARLKLGRMGTTSIAIESDHRLVKDGMYKYIRNPIYLGSIILMLGYCISLSGILSAIITVLYSLAFYIKRIKDEEKMLSGHFQEEYIEYMKKTKRLIPYIY